MENKLFNKGLKMIWDTAENDSDLSHLATHYWIATSNLTPAQDRALESLKNDACEGLASCVEKYYLKD